MPRTQTSPRVFLEPLGLTCILFLQGGDKLERARDLFEQSLEKCPEKFCKPIFLMYAKLEEDHGLAKRAMKIYERAASVVEDKDKFEVRLNNTARIIYPLSYAPPTPDVHHLHRKSD